MHLIDRTRLQILLNRRDSYANSNILPARRCGRFLRRLFNPLSHEVKRRPTLHLQRRPLVMRQHKDRHVIRRRVSPPSLPRFISPRPAHRSEHVPAQNPRAEILKTSCRKLLIDSGAPAFPTMHRAKRLRLERPSMHGHRADAQRVVDTLIYTRAKSIHRNTERTYPKLTHDPSVRLSLPIQTAISANPVNDHSPIPNSAPAAHFPVATPPPLL